MDLVGGHPRGGCAVGSGVGDHVVGEFGLGGEADAVGNTGRLQALGLLGPGPGQVEAAIDESVPCPGGVGEVDRDLGVLDAAGDAGGTSRPRSGWGRLALDTDRCGATPTSGPAVFRCCSVPEAWPVRFRTGSRTVNRGDIMGEPALARRYGSDASLRSGRDAPVPTPWCAASGARCPARTVVGKTCVPPNVPRLPSESRGVPHRNGSEGFGRTTGEVLCNRKMIVAHGGLNRPRVVCSGPPGPFGRTVGRCLDQAPTCSEPAVPHGAGPWEVRGPTYGPSNVFRYIWTLCV